MSSKVVTVSVAVLCSLVTGVIVSHAGPLDPPAGPVTSSFKTLAEVEPRIAINAANTPGDGGGTPSLYKISQPGSYYLTGNATGVSGKIGIEVAASNVTIDLCGYSLSGVPGSLDGIGVTLGGTNLTVRNGNIAFWAGAGIQSTANGQCIENVKALLNTGDGIRVGGGSTVRGCIASQNGGIGIKLDSGAVMSCAARANNGGGFFSGISAAFENCSATLNTGKGFDTGINTSLQGCVVYSGGSHGFSCGAASTIQGCSAFLCAGDGFVLASESIISECAATENTGDGIRIGWQCIARGNTCVNNGYNTGNAAGIHATGNDNRVEGNLCSGGDRGIDVNGTGNVLMRNTCSDNTTNWTIAGGNSYLVVVASKTVSNFSGDAGGGGYGSTDPNANFTH